MTAWAERINSFLHEIKKDEINITVGFIIYGNKIFQNLPFKITKKCVNSQIPVKFKKLRCYSKKKKKKNPRINIK